MINTSKLRECPSCRGEPECRYVYVRCTKCGMQGPQVNGGINDDHVDNMDRERAWTLWNRLPRHGNGDKLCNNCNELFD